VQGWNETDEDTMTYATMNRDFNPGRSPLVGVAAVVAAAVTMGLAVLLPAKLAPTQAPEMAATVTNAPQVAIEAPVEVVTLPAVEVTAARPVKAAAIPRYNVPAIYKKNG
jgi:hypothetical protein